MEPSERPRTSLRTSSKVAIWIVALGVGVLMGLFAWRWTTRAQAAPPDVAPWPVERGPAPVAAPLAPRGALETETVVEGRAPEPATLQSASADPEYQRWLREPDVVSRAVAALARVADGQSPASLVPFLAPGGTFTVVEGGERRVIAPATFARFDRFAAVVDSLDAAKAIAAYRALRPTLSRIHAEIAPPGTTLDVTVRRALDHLLQVRVPAEDIEVVPAKVGITYELVDASLQAWSPAQKHLLRMGPTNAARVQAKLRALRDALP